LHGNLWEDRRELVDATDVTGNEYLPSVYLYNELLHTRKMNRVRKFAEQEGVVIIIIGSSGKMWSAEMRDISKSISRTM
jgi:NAD-dependent SIR2 family protein deacetylase